MENFENAIPPACPYHDCGYHRAPPADFWRPAGIYRTRGYPGGLRRFLCLCCGRTFSIRRFSVEFRLHKPECTSEAISRLVSSVSLRQAARLPDHHLCRSSLERRLLRFGLHGHRLLRRSARLLKLAGEFYLDEAESFEGSRLKGPLTIPILVHGKSRFVLSAHVDSLPMRPSIRKRFPNLPPRPNCSNRVVSRALERLVRVALPGSVLKTDLKPSYASLLRRLDPEGKIVHVRCSSKLRRDVWNPIWTANHTLAMQRDNVSRMRRRTWCHSKLALMHFAHLGLYYAWKDFVRPRFNGEQRSPAQHVGLTKRRWEHDELVRWRLDLGKASIHALVGARHAT
jgi:hypothetical protein